jgi:hypothetical protein
MPPLSSFQDIHASGEEIDNNGSKPCGHHQRRGQECYEGVRPLSGPETTLRLGASQLSSMSALYPRQDCLRGSTAATHGQTTTGFASEHK